VFIYVAETERIDNALQPYSWYSVLSWKVPANVDLRPITSRASKLLPLPMIPTASETLGIERSAASRSSLCPQFRTRIK
jgi:hypothetical protein